MARRLTALILAGACLVAGAGPALAAEPPALRGRALVLMDGQTGQVLYQRNGTARIYPASTTKLLTALVAVEHGSLDQRIKVSREAVDKAPDSASCYISEGDVEPLEYLLYGLLLPSGNDCADAIAEGVSGGRPEVFIDWMNETAQQVGASRSHFANPHGLHDPNHWTTAVDLAKIGRAALADPVVRRIAGTREFIWPGKEENGTYYNLNGMLWDYPGTVGGKTGFTEEAGYNLINAVERDGRLLIGVVAGYKWKGQLYEDMEALLDYGLAEFQNVDAVIAGSLQGEIPVTGGEAESVPVMAKTGFTVSAPRSGPSDITLTPRLETSIQAPVEAGAQVGALEIRQAGQLLGEVPLLAAAGVAARPPLLQRLIPFAAAALRWLAIALGALLLVRTAARLVRRSARPRTQSLHFRSAGGRGDLVRRQTRYHR